MIRNRVVDFYGSNESIRQIVATAKWGDAGGTGLPGTQYELAGSRWAAGTEEDKDFSPSCYPRVVAVSVSLLMV
ncbi:MAG: hypothetical protein A2Y76_05965 [Planctomycetes bacterium RBG_13_60_9]|nr:MAG: hypothetical protein A2Y76_05965 [Planctomycetes bacterium RBG_13_60_9]